jgi:hypothetical protein
MGRLERAETLGWVGLELTTNAFKEAAKTFSVV